MTSPTGTVDTQTKHTPVIDDGGLDMAEELRTVMRWEAHRMGAVSKGVLQSVIRRLDAIDAARHPVKTI